MRKYLLLVWLFALTVQVAFAQDEPKPMSWKDVATWKSMPGGGYKLSPDGQWMAYVLTGIEADGELILQKTADPSSKKSFPIGNTNFASFEFSDNSQWIAFREYPKFKEKEANEKSKGKPVRVCGIGLAGDEPLTEEIAKTRMVCANDETKTGTVTLRLIDLPHPAYITVFHDQNLNGVLDFSTFDLIIVKETGPAEGIGVVQTPDRRDDLKLILPLFLPVGETKMDVQMTYPDSPFWELVKRIGWRLFHDYWVQWSQKLNNPGNDRSPTNRTEQTESP
jgi:hypothetical protein